MKQYRLMALARPTVQKKYRFARRITKFTVSQTPTIRERTI